MSELNFPSEDPLLRKAHESLAATEVPSGPSPELVRQVSDQMRGAVPSVVRGNSRLTSRRTYYAAAAVVFVAVISSMMLSPGNRVLADVVKQLENVKSGTFRLTKTVSGVEVESIKTLFKGKTLQRMEYSSGDIDVVNWERGEHTRLVAAEKRVIVEPVTPRSDGADPISTLKKIMSKPMKEIASRTIDGTSHALGYSRQESDRTETIWVDPKTRLPIRGESTFEDADGKTVTIVHDRAEFNVDFKDSLFEISVPEGYTFVDRRKPGNKIDVFAETIFALEARAREIKNDPEQSKFYDVLRKEIKKMKQKQSKESE